jgi:hypothetical protein
MSYELQAYCLLVKLLFSKWEESGFLQPYSSFFQMNKVFLCKQFDC